MVGFSVAGVWRDSRWSNEAMVLSSSGYNLSKFPHNLNRVEIEISLVILLLLLLLVPR